MKLFADNGTCLQTETILPLQRSRFLKEDFFCTFYTSCVNVAVVEVNRKKIPFLIRFYFILYAIKQTITKCYARTDIAI